MKKYFFIFLIIIAFCGLYIKAEAQPSNMIVEYAKWPEHFAAAAAVAGSADSLQKAEQQISDYLAPERLVKFSDGSFGYIPIQWNFASVDINKVGVSEVSGLFIYPEGTSIDAAVVEPKLKGWISIQDVGSPQIDVWFTARDGFQFPYIPLSCDLAELRIMCRENSGDWKELQQYSGIYKSEEYFTLKRAALNEGSSYNVRMEYPGGTSKTIVFDYNGSLIENFLLLDGDRDGGDSDHETPDTIIQPTPAEKPETAEDTLSPEASDSDGSASAGEGSQQQPEQSGSNYAVYSGKRILEMTAADGTVHISKSGFDLSIPEKELVAAGLSPEERLTIFVMAIGEKHNFMLLINDKVPAEKIAISVKVPADSPLNISDGNSKLLATSAPTAGIVSFTLPEAGEYYISKATAPAPPYKAEQRLPKRNMDERDMGRASGFAALFVSLSAAGFWLTRFL